MRRLIFSINIPVRDFCIQFSLVPRPSSTSSPLMIMSCVYSFFLPPKFLPPKLTMRINMFILALFLLNVLCSGESSRPQAMPSFYPSQFTSLYKAMNGSQGNVYFAGEHLSTYHGWIAGALDSAVKTDFQSFCGRAVSREE